jgi:hypothetical protein
VPAWKGWFGANGGDDQWVLLLELAPCPKHGLAGHEARLGRHHDWMAGCVEERRHEPFRIGRRQGHHDLLASLPNAGIGEHDQQRSGGQLDRRRLDLVDGVARVGQRPGRLIGAVPHLVGRALAGRVDDERHPDGRRQVRPVQRCQRGRTDRAAAVSRAPTAAVSGARALPT